MEKTLIIIPPWVLILMNPITFQVTLTLFTVILEQGVRCLTCRRAGLLTFMTPVILVLRPLITLVLVFVLIITGQPKIEPSRPCFPRLLTVTFIQLRLMDGRNGPRTVIWRVTVTFTLNFLIVKVSRRCRRVIITCRLAVRVIILVTSLRHPQTFMMVVQNPPFVI